MVQANRPDNLSSRLANGFFCSVFGAVLSRGLLFGTAVALGRLLGSSGFGEFGIIQSTMGLFGLSIGAVLSLTITKHTAEFRNINPGQLGDTGMGGDGEPGIGQRAGGGGGILAEHDGHESGDLEPGGVGDPRRAADRVGDERVSQRGEPALPDIPGYGRGRHGACAQRAATGSARPGVAGAGGLPGTIHGGGGDAGAVHAGGRGAEAAGAWIAGGTAGAFSVWDDRCSVTGCQAGVPVLVAAGDGIWIV